MASTPQKPPYEEEQEGQQTEAPDIQTLAVLNQSEINQQIATARNWPRSIKRFRDEALQLCTLDEQTATECIYALPRKQKDKETGQWVLKTIEGPSARFAEIVNYAWGNTRAGSRVIAEEAAFVKSQGLFYDLEKNTAISYEVSRSILDSYGRRYRPDMITVTSNAASSIALRNAILKGIPKALWNPMYQAARSVVAGDVRTLSNRRVEALKAFQIFGVTPEMIYATLGVKGIEDVTIEHLVTLKGLLTALQEGDTTAEQVFVSPQSLGANVRAQNATQQTVSTLADLHTKQAGSEPEGHNTAASDPPQAGESSPNPTPSPTGSPRPTDPPFDAQDAAQKVVESIRQQHSPRRAGREVSKEPPGQPLDFKSRSRGNRFE